MKKVEKIEAKQLKPVTLEMDVISRKTMEEHYKLYQGYVNKYNEVMGKLPQADPAAGNQTYSEIRALKVDLTFAIGGVKNHELYFDILGGNGEPSGRIAEMIDEHFGSFDAFKADLKGTGMASRGWAWLAYDHDWGYLFNYAGDAQNTFPVWNATPILGLDVYEHAYYIDYGQARPNYIDAFFTVIDWEAVNRRLEAVLSGQGKVLGIGDQK